ncbi:MAG: PAS sensor histidine kinase [halophilic archaeon J07HX64]|jgi:PAS domain S-box|nr:MAG: PAS sensor histidine kinase [halophilic archaeon J07HX64]
MPESPGRTVVLYIDGDPKSTALTAAALERRDDQFDVGTATSAEEGLEAVDDVTPDCIVSAYDLPGMDGLAFLETVRAQHPELPFLLFTSEGSETVASDAISAGVTDYLRKQSETEQYDLLANKIENAVAARRAEQRAAGRSREFQQVLETVTTAVVRVDRHGSVVFANRRAAAIFGVEPGGDWGENPAEVSGPDIAELCGDSNGATDGGSDVGAILRQVLDSGEPVDGVRCDICRPDGVERTVEIHGRPLLTDDGAVEGAILSVDNVTAGVERREKLVECSPDFLTVLSESGVVEYQSPAPGGPNEFDPPDLTGHTPIERVHPEERRRVVDAFESVRTGDTGETVRVECRLETSDGEYRWFENRATNYLGHEPVDGILVVTRDIAERKQTEQSLAGYASTVTQLQGATQRLMDTTDRDDAAAITVDALEQAFEFDIAGIWLCNDDGTRLEPVAITEDGRDIVAGELPTYSAETPSLSWEAFESQESRLIKDMDEYTNRYNAETVIQSELIVPLGEHGLLNIGSTTRSAFDERDRHRVELWANMVESALTRVEQLDRLRSREQELQRERDRLDEFAGFVSHDLRSPLTVATGRLELLADDCTSPHLPSIEQALERMDQLIADVLELARQGATVGATVPVDLEELTTQCWRNVDTAEAELSIQETNSISADRSRLASAIENLLRNAIEHGGESVAITVGTLEDEPGFYIADDGPGIPDARQDQIFDSGHSTTDDGTGLGLAIVRQIVEAHGWEIRVCESVDGGTRFEISGVETLT